MYISIRRVPSFTLITPAFIISRAFFAAAWKFSTIASLPRLVSFPIVSAISFVLNWTRFASSLTDRDAPVRIFLNRSFSHFVLSPSFSCVSISPFSAFFAVGDTPPNFSSSCRSSCALLWPMPDWAF